MHKIFIKSSESKGVAAYINMCIKKDRQKRKKELDEKNYSLVMFDHNDEIEKEFKRALKLLGIYMYCLPMCSGMTTYGYILSRYKLSKKEIRRINNLHSPKAYSIYPPGTK
jgi:hypothetical protein